MADTLAQAMIEAQVENVGTYSMVNDELMINDETKTIYVPETERLFGVESDQKTERKHFRCPRYVGDNIDLLEMSISVNFSNASNEKDVYVVEDVKEDVETGDIVFSWLLSRKVTKYKGIIQFIVCATKTNEEGIVIKEWNTTIAEGETLVGLEAEIQPEEGEADVLKQLVDMSLEASRKAEEATNDANIALHDAEVLKSQLEDLIKQAQNALDKLDDVVVKDFREVPVDFTESETLENIASGETVPTVFGKVQRVFNNLGEAASMDVANGLNDIAEQDEKVANAKMLLDVSESKVRYGNEVSRNVKEGTLKTLFEEQESNMSRVLQTIYDLDIDKVDVTEYNERNNAVDQSLNVLSEDVSNINVAPVNFEESESRENLVSGDSITTGFGKIKKWLSDLKQAAFCNVVNGVTQTEAGQAVLDAAVGKYLDEKKLDVSRIVANRNITELGFAMDGKIVADWFNELNGNTGYGNAGSHNSIFRGKYLGNSVTATQWAAISAGTFDDLYIGDYWMIGNVKYRIAGFDLFLNTGDTAFTAHHVVIVPDTNLYSAKMNETNVTTTGYYNSVMKQTNLTTALNTVKSAFGAGHIKSRRALLCNSANTGVPNNWSWYDTQIDLMTERQVYGSPAWGTQNQNGFNAATQYSRFPLFSLAPEFITNRSWYWLQDVVNASCFAFVYGAGNVSHDGASGSGGVRPAFLIG